MFIYPDRVLDRAQGTIIGEPQVTGLRAIALALASENPTLRASRSQSFLSITIHLLIKFISTQRPTPSPWLPSLVLSVLPAWPAAASPPLVRREPDRNRLHPQALHQFIN